HGECADGPLSVLHVRKLLEGRRVERNAAQCPAAVLVNIRHVGNATTARAAGIGDDPALDGPVPRWRARVCVERRRRGGCGGGRGGGSGGRRQRAPRISERLLTQPVYKIVWVGDFVFEKIGALERVVGEGADSEQVGAATFAR